MSRRKCIVPDLGEVGYLVADPRRHRFPHLSTTFVCMFFAVVSTFAPLPTSPYPLDMSRPMCCPVLTCITSTVLVPCRHLVDMLDPEDELLQVRDWSGDSGMMMLLEGSGDAGRFPLPDAHVAPRYSRDLGCAMESSREAWPHSEAKTESDLVSMALCASRVVVCFFFSYGLQRTVTR